MWEVFETTQKKPETAFFDDWINQQLRNPTIMRRVRDAYFEAEAVAPELTLLRTTAQSPPYHAEGPMVIDHLERMLAGFFAIVDGKSLLSIEEFAREQAWHPVLQELQDRLRENAATMEAFIFLHDLAKASTISFSSPEGSKGFAEGFIAEGRLGAQTLNQRYGKLIRAQEAQSEELSSAELVQWFYDQQQIRVHYHGHATEVMNDRYDSAREALSDLYRLTGRDRELLALLVSSHIDVLSYFGKREDPAKIDVLIKRANKLGLDGDDVLDLQMAALLLDTVIGSLRYEHGKAWCDIDPLVNMLKSEQAGMPVRHQGRVDRQELRQKQARKRAMKQAGIDAMQLIELLALPVGPQRAEVLMQIDQLIEHGSEPIPMDVYPTAVVQGIAHARALYQSQKAQ